MDLSTYAGLQSAVADFLNRPDLSTGGQIVGFIQLAEGTMARRLMRRSFTALSGSNTSNSILVAAPDAYLYGACLEAAAFLEHDERVPVWKARFDAAIAELNERRVVASSMDLTSYTGLKAAVSDFLNRDDLNLGGEVSGFVTLAEATIKRRLRRTSVVGSLNIVSGNSSPLPADCSELRSMSPSASNTNLPQGAKALDQVSFETFADLQAALPPQGRPRYFSVLAGTVYVAPLPGPQYTAFTISYFKTFTPLSATNASNTLLVEAPDAYLYGACLEAAPYLGNDERVPVWQARFDTVIEELNEKRQHEEFGASLTKARLPMVF